MVKIYTEGVFLMKQKKVYIYLMSFIGLTVMFSASYYLSYRHALYEFNRNSIERNSEYAKLEKDINIEPEYTTGLIESQTTTTVNSLTVLPSTTYKLELYDKATDNVETKQQNPPADIVGLTREEIIEYTEKYMEDMTLSEYNNGLFAYELLSFSEDEVVMRKSYDVSSIPFRFYVVVKNGFVIVYNSDLKSVHSYTGIEASKLPEGDRVQLSKGIYINTLEELYGLLESYTS